MQNEIREDTLKVKRMIADVEIILGKREGETELVNKLIDAENLLTYCMSRLENAIVPPCKVGDTVYFIENEQVRCGEVVEIRRYKDPEVISENSPIQEIYYVNSAVICFPMGCSELTPYTRDDFGKIVFHTKEAAEKALKEGADNG